MEFKSSKHETFVNYFLNYVCVECLFVCNRGDTILCSRQAPANKRNLCQYLSNVFISPLGAKASFAKSRSSLNCTPRTQANLHCLPLSGRPEIIRVFFHEKILHTYLGWVGLRKNWFFLFPCSNLYLVHLILTTNMNLEIWQPIFVYLHLSRSAHRTPNFMNPEYFVCLRFEYFFQIKVLN